jgi:ammonium transporter Rh
MSDIEGYSLIPKDAEQAWDLPKTFSASVAVVLFALLAGLAALTDFTVENATDKHVDQYYMYYIHVAMMIFIGFGFLMTFLRRYSYSAVGLNFFASCVVMLEFVVIGGAVQQVRFVRMSDYFRMAERSRKTGTHMTCQLAAPVRGGGCAGQNIGT